MGSANVGTNRHSNIDPITGEVTEAFKISSALAIEEASNLASVRFLLISTPPA